MAAGHKHESIRLECGLTPSDAYTFCGSEDGELSQRAVRRILDSGDHCVLSIPPQSMEAHKRALWAAAGRICYWDLVEESLVESFQAHAAVITGLAMHPKGNSLLTASTDGLIKVWQ